MHFFCCIVFTKVHDARWAAQEEEGGNSVSQRYPVFCFEARAVLVALHFVSSCRGIYGEQ